MNANTQYRAVGEDIWKNRTVKINAELLVLTYGSIVAQLFREYKRDVAKVNAKLFQMGHNIGVRLVEDFYARTALGRCRSIEEMAQVVTQIAFKVFLNITPQCTITNDSELHIYLAENPFSAFVELPPMHAGEGSAGAEESSTPGEKFWYSNILCGVIQGALKMCAIDCRAEFVRDVLLGDNTTEIKISQFKFLKDEVPAGED